MTEQQFIKNWRRFRKRRFWYMPGDREIHYNSTYPKACYPELQLPGSAYPFA